MGLGERTSASLAAHVVWCKHGTAFLARNSESKNLLQFLLPKKMKTKEKRERCTSLAIASLLSSRRNEDGLTIDAVVKGGPPVLPAWPTYQPPSQPVIASQ